MVIGLAERFGRWPIAVFVGFTLSAVALALASLAGLDAMFFAAYAVNYAADWYLRLRGNEVNRAMRRFGFGEQLREFSRLLLLVVFALTVESPGLVLVVAIVTVLFVSSSSHGPLGSYSVRHRNVPVAVLNLDMSELRVPDGPPPGTWNAKGLGRIPGPELLVPASLAIVLGGAGVGWLALGALAPLISLFAVMQLGLRAIRNRHIPEPEEMLEIVNRRLDEYRPEVALYFTFAESGQDFMYQVNMWIEALERLDRRTVIVLRETSAMWKLERTRLPVVCARKADHLALLEMPDVRVVLYPGNAGKNVHMLQRAEAQHVFIGHGDSDKLASSNRVSRVFDEIWVAGKAGRDRYRRVQHAIEDKTIVEVGRPQLEAVTPAVPGRAAAGPTVLYGPTWEGWSDDACYTSLIPMGERIIKELLRQDDVRVVYKPHPLTGRRSPEAAQADQLVQDLLRADNERRAARLDPKAVAAIESRLAELDERISELAGLNVSGDRLQRTRDARRVDSDVRGELEELRRQWSELFWDDAYQGRRHLIVTERQPSLYDCFNHSDLLISDMSSVISDFVASCKPYVVTNALDEDDAAFRLQYPTAGAAYLLGSDCSQLPAILTAVRDPEHDALARRRVELKEYLLGSDEITSMDLFNGAVESLYQQGLRNFPLGTRAEPAPAAPDYTDLIPAARSAAAVQPMASELG